MCLSPVDELKRDFSFESHIMIQKTSLNQTFNFYTPHCISAKRVYSTNIYEIFWLLLCFFWIYNDRSDEK